MKLLKITTSLEEWKEKMKLLAILDNSALQENARRLGFENSEQWIQKREKTEQWNKAVNELENCDSSLQEQEKKLQELALINNNLLQENFRKMGYESPGQLIAERRAQAEERRRTEEEEFARLESANSSEERRQIIVQMTTLNETERARLLKKVDSIIERREQFMENSLAKIKSTTCLEELKGVIEEILPHNPLLQEDLEEINQEITQKNTNPGPSNNYSGNQSSFDLSSVFSLKTVPKSSSAGLGGYNFSYQESSISSSSSSSTQTLKAASHGHSVGKVVQCSDCKAVSCSRAAKIPHNYCDYHQACIAKVREKADIPGSIEEIETFSTWFNGNCGYVINKDDATDKEYPFYVWAVIYEPEYEKIEEKLAALKLGIHYEKLAGAQKKAQVLKEKLQKESIDANPILEVFSQGDEYISFDNIVCEPYISKEELSKTTTKIVFSDRFDTDEPCRTYDFDPLIRTQSITTLPSNPEEYLKPLDVVWTQDAKLVSFYHVGIYLGKIDGEHKVCDFSKKENGITISKWSDFTGGFISGNDLTSEDTSGTHSLIRIHPVIPFKNYRKIAKQIAWTLDVDYWKNDYCLANQNCEHFANTMIFGINYSEQVSKKPGGCSLFSKYNSVNNGKGSTIRLLSEINETNNKLGEKVNKFCKEIEAKVMVIPPKQNCRIM